MNMGKKIRSIERTTFDHDMACLPCFFFPLYNFYENCF